jgi:hypothetical protein
VRLRREEVDGVRVFLIWSTILDLLNVCELLSDDFPEAWPCLHTRDVLIEYVVLFDHIVYDLAAVFVDDHDLPLARELGELDYGGGRAHTSPRVVFRMRSMMTAKWSAWPFVVGEGEGVHTVPLDLDDGNAHGEEARRRLSCGGVVLFRVVSCRIVSSRGFVELSSVGGASSLFWRVGVGVGVSTWERRHDFISVTWALHSIHDANRLRSPSCQCLH